MIEEKMKAVICSAYGTPDVLQIKHVKKPVPKHNELLVRIMATSVNSGDVRVRALKANFFSRIIMRLVFGFTKPRKPILGTVYSGIVGQTGNQVKNFKVGDEVYGLTGFSFGTYAEFIAVQENSVVTLKPQNTTFEEAAAIPFGAHTAIYFLQKTKLGQSTDFKILVYGGSGAVGTSAIQIAKYYNAHVTVVCGNTGKDLVKKLGADRVIIYTQEDLRNEAIKYDVIFDAVGKLSKKQCRHLLYPNGKFLTVGGLDYAAETKEQLLFAKKLVELGKYDACTDRVYELNDIVEAHQYVDTERKKGNVVVRVNE